MQPSNSTPPLHNVPAYRRLALQLIILVLSTTIGAAAQITSSVSERQVRYSIDQQETDGQPLAVVRYDVEPSKVSPSIAEGLAKVGAHLTELGVALETPVARFLSRGERVELEVGYPVDTPIQPAGDVRPSALPAASVAVTEHVGSYVNMADCYTALGEWVGRQGYTATGSGWEVYLVNPGMTREPGAWRTRVFLEISQD